MSGDKDLHLMLTMSFWVNTLSQMAVFGFVIHAAMQVPALALWVDTLMQQIHFQFLEATDYLAWWSVLAMFASACCLLQLLLNLLSIGCAGFNTVLGPWRPTFMAVMILMQIFQWRLAARRFDLVNRAIVSTVISVTLTLLPELLYVKNFVWKTSSTSSSTPGDKCSTAEKAAAQDCSTIVLKTEDMGCIACVDTVRNSIVQLTKVISCDVSFESKLVAVTCAGRPDDDGTKKLATEVADAMEAVGFSASVQGISAAKHHRQQPSPAVPEVGSRCRRWVAGVVAGLLSSSCCLVQLGLNFLGSMNVVHVGCAGFNKVLGPVRSAFRGVTGAGLLYLWTVAAWHDLRDREKAKKVPGSRTRRLLLPTLTTLVLMFLPELLRHMGGPKVAPPVDSVDKLVVTIDNMGCEACQYTVQGLIDRTDGVVASNLDFATGIAEIFVARDWGFDAKALEEELMYQGYTLLMGTGHETVHMRRLRKIEERKKRTAKQNNTVRTPRSGPAPESAAEG